MEYNLYLSQTSYFMIRYILDNNNFPLTWIDISSPTQDDFYNLKDIIDINSLSIKNALELGNLPKIEEVDNYHFLILRSISPILDEEATSLTELTDRISIFYNKNTVITSHRNEVAFLEELINNADNNKKIQSAKALINTLVSEALKTFENQVIQKIDPKLNQYEEMVFLQRSRKSSLKKLYHIKRQIDILRNVLTFYKDIVDYFHIPEYKNIYTQNLKDAFSRNQVIFKNSSETTSQLLTIYFNIESNHTNEIMRLLTIISVFFMPLTFLTGMYGMNFDFMPGIHTPYGYLTLLGLMLVLSFIIYILFKKKRWL